MNITIIVNRNNRQHNPNVYNLRTKKYAISIITLGL